MKYRWIISFFFIEKFDMVVLVLLVYLLNNVRRVSPGGLAHKRHNYERDHRADAEDHHHWETVAFEVADEGGQQHVGHHHDDVDVADTQGRHLGRVQLTSIHESRLEFQGHCKPEDNEDDQLQDQSCCPAVLGADFLFGEENQGEGAE
jgi:hypothetical protein